MARKPEKVGKFDEKVVEMLLTEDPNSTTRANCFCPLVGCKYLLLTLSSASWVFQSAVMLGPFL